MNKGKLRRSLGEKCPLCKSVLQVRVREERIMFKGTPLLKDKEYIMCSNELCEYERDVVQKRRKLREKDIRDI